MGEMVSTFGEEQKLYSSTVDKLWALNRLVG